tara:strand:- start:62 stop:433 length:372 start_codon:yes stop_codon:yes gene_type:complete
MDKELSLKISLDEILEEGFDYERKVMENLFRFSNYIGVKHFKVVFLHKNVSTEKINKFVERNENVLFHINSKITKNDCTTWFIIEKEKTEHKFLTYRYKYIGSILNGLPRFFEVAKTLKEKNE